MSFQIIPVASDANFSGFFFGDIWFLDPALYALDFELRDLLDLLQSPPEHISIDWTVVVASIVELAVEIDPLPLDGRLRKNDDPLSG